MRELKEHRDQFKKVYFDGVEREHHVGILPMHYDNSQRKIGNGGYWRTIDRTWKKGTPDSNGESQHYIPEYSDECFYIDYSVDALRAPLYADGKIRIINHKNNTGESLSLIPLNVNHVEGVLQGDSVKYPNAYGTDKHFIVRARPISGLTKLIQLDAYDDTVDYEFEFEIIVDNYINKSLKILRVLENNYDDNYEINLSLLQNAKVFDNHSRRTVIGKAKDNGIVFLPPKAWYYDDTGQEVNTNIITTLRYENNKYILKKILPKEFLQQANGRTVYTDTDTTVNWSRLHRIQTGNDYNTMLTKTGIWSYSLDNVVRASYLWHPNGAHEYTTYTQAYFSLSGLTAGTYTSAKFKYGNALDMDTIWNSGKTYNSFKGDVNNYIIAAKTNNTYDPPTSQGQVAGNQMNRSVPYSSPTNVDDIGDDDVVELTLNSNFLTELDARINASNNTIGLCVYHGYQDSITHPVGVSHPGFFLSGGTITSVTQQPVLVLTEQVNTFNQFNFLDVANINTINDLAVANITFKY